MHIGLRGEYCTALCSGRTPGAAVEDPQYGAGGRFPHRTSSSSGLPGRSAQHCTVPHCNAAHTAADGAVPSHPRSPTSRRPPPPCGSPPLDCCPAPSPPRPPPGRAGTGPAVATPPPATPSAGAARPGTAVRWPAPAPPVFLAAPTARPSSVSASRGSSPCSRTTATGWCYSGSCSTAHKAVGWKLR